MWNNGICNLSCQFPIILNSLNDSYCMHQNLLNSCSQGDLQKKKARIIWWANSLPSKQSTIPQFHDFHTTTITDMPSMHLHREKNILKILGATFQACLKITLFNSYAFRANSPRRSPVYFFPAPTLHGAWKWKQTVFTLYLYINLHKQRCAYMYLHKSE